MRIRGRFHPVIAGLLLATVFSACDDGSGPSQNVANIMVNASSGSLQVGGTLQLMATLLNTDGVTMSGQSVTWTSQHPSVASVTTGGLVTGLTAGTATIRASNGNAAAYVTLTVLPAACTATSTVGSIGVGQTVNATLTPAVCAMPSGSSAHGRTFTVATPTSVAISMTSTQFDAVLYVTDAALNLVAFDDDGGEGLNARLLHTFMPGSYIVWASSYMPGATGAYTLSIQPVTLCDAAAAAGSIAVGQTRSGAVAGSSCLLPHGHPGQGWRFAVTEAMGIEFDVQAAGFEPFVVVSDLELNPLQAGYPVAAGGRTVLFHHFQPGEYVLWTTTVEGGTGSYEVAMRQAQFATCEQPATPIAAGQTRTGTLTSASCRLRDGRSTDSWQLTLDAATTLRIDMTSTAFDAFLIVTDAGGAIVALDDDGGVGVNARITQHFAAGSYTIWTTSFMPGMSGGYQLAVQPFSGLVTQSDPAVALLPSKASAAAPAAKSAPTAADWLRRWSVPLHD
jgi:hypothetical protein